MKPKVNIIFRKVLSGAEEITGTRLDRAVMLFPDTLRKHPGVFIDSPEIDVVDVFSVGGGPAILPTHTEVYRESLVLEGWRKELLLKDLLFYFPDYRNVELVEIDFNAKDLQIK